MKYSMYNKEREPSSQRTNISPTNKERMNIQMYNAWQPSLVLGGLGRALTGPYSPQGL
jgi:hypothetical protein